MASSPTHNSRSLIECLAATKARRVPHPAESLDPSPDDLFSFGHLKGKVGGISVETQEELIPVIRRNVASITKDQLMTVDMNWMKRLKRASKHHAEYDHP
jgi:hypothetical protein